MNLMIHTDGGSRANPGPSAAAVIIRDADTNKTLHEAAYFLGRATNNVAEYEGLIRALKIARQLGAKRVQIFADSELMVRQTTGQYRVKSAELKPLAQQAQSLLLKIDTWRIEHIPREQNREADQLVNRALDAGHDIQGSDSEQGGQTSASAGRKTKRTMPKNQTGWTVKFLKAPPKACPARCPKGSVFRFGPDTPAGFCIHAAQAVFDENPVLWSQVARTQSQTHCPHCDAPLSIERIQPK